MCLDVNSSWYPVIENEATVNGVVQTMDEVVGKVDIAGGIRENEKDFIGDIHIIGTRRCMDIIFNPAFSYNPHAYGDETVTYHPDPGHVYYKKIHRK
jgi:hypothetical protein